MKTKKIKAVKKKETRTGLNTEPAISALYCRQKKNNSIKKNEQFLIEYSKMSLKEIMPCKLDFAFTKLKK